MTKVPVIMSTSAKSLETIIQTLMKGATPERANEIDALRIVRRRFSVDR